MPLIDRSKNRTTVPQTYCERKPVDGQAKGALTVARYVGESVFIGQHIKVTLISTEGSRARLRIEAPLDLPIAREELVLTNGFDLTRSARG